MDKSSFVFLTIPDSLQSGAFEADPSILLPIECDPDGKIPDIENITWETILSGMLRIIASGGNNVQAEIHLKAPLIIKHGDIIPEPDLMRIPPGWVDYYRIFVLAVKPGIYHEFTSASIVKAQNGEYDLALEINGILEGLIPGSPGVLLNKALILENKAASAEKGGQETGTASQEALNAYEKAMSMEPALPDTFFNAGFFYLRLREYSRAMDCFSRFISSAEEPAIEAEKIRQAKKIIKEIKEQGLDDTNFREAFDCIENGDEENGLIKIREFIEKHPRVWNGWFVLGWALRKLGRFKDGLEAFNKAVDLGGASIDIMNESAICLMELGDLKGARKKLEAALCEEPENIKIISNLGVLAMKTGSKEEAEAFFRTVRELDPEDPLAAKILSR